MLWWRFQQLRTLMTTCDQHVISYAKADEKPSSVLRHHSLPFGVREVNKTHSRRHRAAHEFRCTKWCYSHRQTTRHTRRIRITPSSFLLVTWNGNISDQKLDLVMVGHHLVADLPFAPFQLHSVKSVTILINVREIVRSILHTVVNSPTGTHSTLTPTCSTMRLIHGARQHCLHKKNRNLMHTIKHADAHRIDGAFLRVLATFF